MYTHLLIHFHGKPYFRGAVRCLCGNMLKNKHTQVMGYIWSRQLEFKHNGNNTFYSESGYISMIELRGGLKISLPDFCHQMHQFVIISPEL